MERPTVRIGPGGRERESGGSLAGLATAMLRVHGFDRNGRERKVYAPSVRTKRTQAKRTKAPAAPVKRMTVSLLNKPGFLNAPRPKLPDTIGQSRTATRNLNVTD